MHLHHEGSMIRVHEVHEDNVETIWEKCGDHIDVETTWG